MNQSIDTSGMPKAFTVCNVAGCPLSKTCLRCIMYPTVASKEKPYIEVINPEWVAAQKGQCRMYLKNERVRRARGFMRTIRAIPTGHINSFRTLGISKMGYKRYYQARRGEILLTPAEEEIVIKLANRFGVKLDEYFDGYTYVLLWG